MNYQNYVELKGSQKLAPFADKTVGLNKRQPISVTVLLRPKEPFPNLTNATQYKKFKSLSLTQYKTKHGLQKADIDKVVDFSHQSGLAVRVINESNRTIELRGSIAHLENAFQCELEKYTTVDGKIFRGRS